MERKGIAVAGNLIVDTVKSIPSFPSPGMLVNILSASRSPGGIVPNVLIDLARMGDDIPLTAIGCMGRDEAGDYVQNTLEAEGISTEYITRLDTATSYTDVMNATDTGERTFFTYDGANALFSPEHIPFDTLDAKILHIGYILLLKVFDSPDPEYGTVMALALKAAQEHGMLTSIDCVSNIGEGFSQKVKAALPYCDYVILNEIEGCAVWGLPARDTDGSLIEANIKTTLESFLTTGVNTAVIHCPEAGYALNTNGTYTKVPSLTLPDGWIKGSVGAGDAFCAGCLRALYKGLDPESMLRFAAACAAASLSEPGATAGMRSEAEIMKLYEKYGS